MTNLHNKLNNKIHTINFISTYTIKLITKLNSKLYNNVYNINLLQNLQYKLCNKI